MAWTAASSPSTRVGAAGSETGGERRPGTRSGTERFGSAAGSGRSGAGRRPAPASRCCSPSKAARRSRLRRCSGTRTGSPPRCAGPWRRGRRRRRARGRGTSKSSPGPGRCGRCSFRSTNSPAPRAGIGERGAAARTRCCSGAGTRARLRPRPTNRRTPRCSLPPSPLRRNCATSGCPCGRPATAPAAGCSKAAGWSSASRRWRRRAGRRRPSARPLTRC